MIPKKLQKGDTIGIISPSKPLDKLGKLKLQKALGILKRMGLKIVLGKNAFKVDRYGISAGTPQEKSDDINGMFKNKKVKAIWCSQGGVTTSSTLELIDYDLIKKNPKIFMGLSDITILINAIYKKTGLVTFHFGDPKALLRNDTFYSEYSHDEFRKRLMEGEIGEINRRSEWKTVRGGKAKGRLIGGNINALLGLSGTEFFPETKGCILLLEAYKRMDIARTHAFIEHLKLMDVFKQIKAVIVGYVYSFQFRKDESVQFEDVLLELTKDYKFPTLKINEFGHRCPNTVLPIGVLAEVDATNKSFKIIEKCVEQK